MPGAFQGLSTLSSALEAFQTQIDVTGENISNVNTPGYVEQTTNLQSAPESNVTQGATIAIGNGVTIESITNIQNAYLDVATNSAASDLGKANAQAQTLTSVNSIVADPDSTGLASQIDGFYNSWSSLASNSTSANQLGVQQSAQTLATTLNNTYSSLDSVKQSATQQVTSLLQQVESEVTQIAQLNQNINVDKVDGSTPNDLMDQRDQAVSNLSSLINVTVNKSADGTYSINSGNLVLVNQSGAAAVPTGFDPATGSLTTTSGASYPVTSGQISGLMDSINNVSSYESSLNTLAQQMATSVNAVYSTATNSSGQTGADFFTGSVTDGSFGLSSPIQSNPTSIAVGTSGATSDTGVAQQIANLSTTQLSGLGSQSPSSYYGQLVAQIGSQGKTANSSQTTQQAVSNQVAAQVSSVSGVNLDTEMANLLRYQGSYQAAAQALSAMDQTVQSMLTVMTS
jgi:flagellar hook-associated protein 1 FlgK